jgi:hypothetical protein
VRVHELRAVTQIGIEPEISVNRNTLRVLRDKSNAEHKEYIMEKVGSSVLAGGGEKAIGEIIWAYYGVVDIEPWLVKEHVRESIAAQKRERAVRP